MDLTALMLRDSAHIAYFAGGCVRDELLGLRPTDYDVATDATPPTPWIARPPEQRASLIDGALADLAAAHRRTLTCPVIGITGSVGAHGSVAG